jgi:glutathione reductase (NADPH)
MHCPNVLRGGSRSLSSAEGQTYDLIVIGAGSGGLACAKRSASYGKKVAVIEDNRYGGTCVNVGCVPKKVMYNTSHVRETIHEAKNFGFEVDEPKFNWEKIKAYRDRYVKRLNGIYSSGLQKLNITMINGTASFDDKKTVRVGHETYKADNILIAVGGTPNKLGVPGDEYAIDSDGFFELEKLPKKATVLGAGYIAVELAGVLNGLGSDTSLMVRGDKALRSFDPMLSTFLDREMKKAGMNVVTGATPKAITKEADGTLTVHTQDGRVRQPSKLFIKSDNL